MRQETAEAQATLGSRASISFQVDFAIVESALHDAPPSVLRVTRMVLAPLLPERSASTHRPLAHETLGMDSVRLDDVASGAAHVAPLVVVRAV
jgi:hypothetical protein